MVTLLSNLIQSLISLFGHSFILSIIYSIIAVVNISIAYPWWMIGFCLLAGALYAAISYFRSKDSHTFDEYPWVSKVLPVFRFVLVSMLAFLLLGPVLKYVGYQTEKPIVAVLVDESLSVHRSDTAMEQLKAMVAEWEKQAGEKIEVQTIGFSNVASFKKSVDLVRTGSESNISGALRFAKDQYVNQNLGSVVLLSDGIYNAGSNPSFAQNGSKIPVYTIGLGDTTIYADLAVSNVAHNSIAYLGDEFPFRVELKASELAGKQAVVRVLLNGKLLESKSFAITDNAYYKELDILARAQKVGQNKVDVVLTTFDSESNKENNRFTFYVDVIDGKKKVAIWATAPHPDLGTLQSAIGSNENYEATIELTTYEVSPSLDLVVLHDWFSDRAQLARYEKLRANGVPVLLIIGQNFDPRIFNQGSQAVKYTPRGRAFNATLPLVNGAFEYFEIGDEVKASIKKWPPLRTPFGRYSGYKPSDVLLYQQIGAVATQEPMVLLRNDKNKRLGIVGGTGIWRWRLAEYEANESHAHVNTLLTNMVQYLAVKEDKKLLKVYPTARQYGRGERVTVLGELYNQSLDAIAGQEINVELKDDKGKTYKHTMTASGSQYRLLLQNLDEGAYTYTAKATVGGISLSDRGGFTVNGQQKELLDLTANHTLLKAVATSSGGKFMSLMEAGDLVQQWNESGQFTSVISEENKLTELIKFRWIFWMLFGLLALEWFVRKWAGGY